MNTEFMLLDDDSELVIGHCQNIIGLEGTIYTDQGLKFHKVEFQQLILSDEFQEYITKNKESMNRLIYICILDSTNETICKIPFFIFDDIYYSKIGFPHKADIVVWRGSLESVLSQEQLDIYSDWINFRPTQRNQWVPWSNAYRRAWLRIVKNYNINQVRMDEGKDKYFILDGTNITDYPAFFCALGEAINGPGGYYGSDIYSMIDCFYGGFGTKGSFALVWDNHDIAKVHLDEQCWLEEIAYRQVEKEHLLSEVTLQEVVSGSLFESLFNTMKEHSIHVILK